MFSCRLADVKQEMLETIVPKHESDLIMVVLGEHKGQVSSPSSSRMVSVPTRPPVTVYLHLFPGGSDSSAGQEQVQSDSAAGAIWGQSVSIRLRLYLPLCGRSRALILHSHVNLFKYFRGDPKCLHQTPIQA